MKDHINEYFSNKNNRTTSSYQQFKRIVLNNGVSLSVQAGERMYSEPRRDDYSKYMAVEVGFPSEEIDELVYYAEDPNDLTETVYPYVPVEVVNKYIEEAGGIISHNEEILC